MKQIIKTIRFSIDNRKLLTDAVLQARMENQKIALSEITQKAVQRMVDQYWQAFSIDKKAVAKLGPGIVPQMKAFNVISGETVHVLDADKDYGVPFEVFAEPKVSYTRYIGESLATEFDKVIKAKLEYEAEQQNTSSKLMSFFNEFNSPARLLEKAPDFEKYMPDDWFEETDKELVSINDLLAA